MCFSHLFGTVSFFSIAQRPAAAAAAAHVLSFHVETKPSIYLLPYVESQRNMLQCNALAEWLMFGHYQAILHYKSRFFFLLKWRLKNISRVLVTKITRFCLRRRRRSAFRAKNAQLLQDCWLSSSLRMIYSVYEPFNPVTTDLSTHTHLMMQAPLFSKLTKIRGLIINSSRPTSHGGSVTWARNLLFIQPTASCLYLKIDLSIKCNRLP